MADPGRLRPVLIRLLEGRVGSTLLMQLLGSSPEVLFDRVYPFENSYLTYLVRLTGQLAATPPAEGGMIDLLYGDVGRVGPLPFPPQSLSTATLASESLAAVWDVLSATMRAGSGTAATLYAEKYWGDLGPVVDAGLDPLVIDLVRDPRDVVASVRAFNATTGRQRFGRAQAHDDDQHLRRIVTGMRLRLREFSAPLPVQRLVVRYEDLVSDLPAEAARLEALLGVRLGLDAVRDAIGSMAGHMTSASAEESVGRFNRDLSADDVAAVERPLARQMAELGYPPSGGASA